MNIPGGGIKNEHSRRGNQEWTYQEGESRMNIPGGGIKNEHSRN